MTIDLINRDFLEPTSNQGAASGGSGAFLIEASKSGGVAGKITLNTDAIAAVTTQVSGSTLTDQLLALKDIATGLGGNFKDPVIDILATPPGSPTTGDRYIVASSPTGAWVGHTNDIATWSGSAWTFTTPSTNWSLIVTNLGGVAGTNALYLFAQTVWSRSGGVVTADGVNETATRIWFTPARQTKLDGMPADALSSAAHAGLGGSVHANVVAAGAAGFMTGSDKTKLDGIAAGAQVNPTQVNSGERSAPPSNTSVRGFSPNDVLITSQYLAQGQVYDYTSTPPASGTLNRRYLVGASPTGVWASQAGKIATCTVTGSPGTYTFISPVTGMKVCVTNYAGGSNTFLFFEYDGVGWRQVGIVNPTADQVTDTASKVLMTPAERTELAQWTALTSDGYVMCVSGVPQLVSGGTPGGYVGVVSTAYTALPSTAEYTVFSQTLSRLWMASPGCGATARWQFEQLAISGASGQAGSPQNFCAPVFALYVDGAKVVGDASTMSFAGAVRPGVVTAYCRRVVNPATPTDRSTDLLLVRFELSLCGGLTSTAGTPDFIAGGVTAKGNLSSTPSPTAAWVNVLCSHDWSTDVAIAFSVTPASANFTGVTGVTDFADWHNTITSIGATTTNGSPNVTLSAAQTALVPGVIIAGTNIPANATIVTVTDSTHIVISANATASGSTTLTATWPQWFIRGTHSLVSAEGIVYQVQTFPAVATYAASSTSLRTTHVGQEMRFTNSIPTLVIDGSTAFATDQRVDVIAMGGDLTISVVAPATANQASGDTRVIPRYAAATIICTAANTYLIIGRTA